MFKKNGRYLLCAMMLCSVLAMVGCASSTDDSFPDANNDQVNDLDHYLSRNSADVKQIATSGVQVIEVGNTVTLVLSSDDFFVDDTPVLSSSGYSALNQVATFLNARKKLSIRVVGYTDDKNWTERNIALSRQQAQTVASYLWKKGVDARVLAATGYGSKFSVASNATEQGRSYNRRVEIVLQLITDYSVD